MNFDCLWFYGLLVFELVGLVCGGFAILNVFEACSLGLGFVAIDLFGWLFDLELGCLWFCDCAIYAA